MPSRILHDRTEERISNDKNRRWCTEKDTGKRYWCGPTSPTPWEKIARRPEMTKVTLTEKHHKDGTITRTVKCSLEEVTDVYGDAVPNPIQTLYWNEQTQDYQLYWDKPDTVYITDFAREPIEARECWCARVFHSFSGFFNEEMGIDDDLSVLNFSEEPVFCPIDTNADNLLGKGDVRSCTALAVFAPDGTTILAKDSACVQAEPWTEFVRSSWPLCFFWWIVLLYILFASQYGRRVRSFVWRHVCLQTSKFSSKPEKYARAGATNYDTETTNTETSNDNTDEENGDIELPQVSLEQPGDSAPPREESIEEEFGSLLNYNLLDRDLREQARVTDNEIVAWLWYSAVYNEVRRYRYNQWMRRRQRVTTNNNTNNSNDNDDNDDDDSDADGSIDDMSHSSQFRTQRLDAVYWWPPQSPSGERWEHLRAGAQRPTHDEHGNPVDPNRLTLKTKRFALEDELPQNQSNSNALLIEPKDTTSTDSTADDTNLDKEGTILDGYDIDGDEIGDNVCSICLCELEEGDLVGDIQCGHYFHKECLKEWLVKNNHCPICRMPGIASHPIRDLNN